MPGTLQIGRVVLPNTAFLLTRGAEGLMLRSGTIESGLPFEDGAIVARAWEDDLKSYESAGDIVPVTYSGSGQINGWYKVAKAEIETYAPYSNFGFSLDLDYATILGGRSSQDLKFESSLTGATLLNDFSISTASEPIHAPPPHTGYDPSTGITSSMLRSTADGVSLRIYRDVTFVGGAKWSATPADWYLGAARIERTVSALPASGNVAGVNWAGSVNGLRLSNGLVRSTLGNDAGNISVEFWDGTAWRAKAVSIYGSAGQITAWDNVAILHNTAHRCALRYERGITTGGRTTLDLTLRRGMRGLIGLLTTHETAQLAIQTASTPTPFTQTAERIRQTTADAEGHRLVFATPRSYTFIADPGRIEKSATVRLDFLVALELSGAVAGDIAVDLSMQYIGHLSEDVKAVRR